MQALAIADSIVEKLLDKSKEAFVMAIEVYNKPSIRYRVEGFSFFICNAWELMLKAHLIKTDGESSIYYKDHPDRTISLEVCVRTVFTNEKAPLRLNLEKIIELRNTSTHFIVEEYEMVYIPLFQACVFNFIEKMQLFHNIDMTEVIPQNFLTLAVSMKALNEAEIRAKYPGQVAEKLLHTREQLSPMINANNQAFAIRIEHYHYITKKREQATEFVHIEKDAPDGVQIVKELKDPNDVFKYTAKKCISEIKTRLKRQGVVLMCKGSEHTFNMADFKLFTKHYDLKSNTKFCYVYRVNANPTYSYSIQAIDFIVEEIKKDPENIIQGLRDLQRKK